MYVYVRMPCPDLTARSDHSMNAIKTDNSNSNSNNNNNSSNNNNDNSNNNEITRSGEPHMCIFLNDIVLMDILPMNILPSYILLVESLLLVELRVNAFLAHSYSMISRGHRCNHPPTLSLESS